MRNLKKILALALALVMTLSVMSVANAFTDDKDFNADYTEAATVLTGLGVLQGYTDGSFAPKGEITRAEVAAVIYRIATGDVKDAQVGIYADYNKFKDVKSTAWYAGYVNYCANAEFIKGYGNGNFGPNDKVTGYQALAMILRAVGYDVNGEFTGSSWQVQVARTAKELSVTDTVLAGTLGQAATREVVAELLFRTLVYAPIVKYTTAFGYQPVTTIAAVNVITGTVSTAVTGQTLGMKTFGLKQSTRVNIDNWGRPGYYWYCNKTANTWNAGNIVATIEEQAVKTSTTAVTECDVAKDAGVASEKTYALYVNSNVASPNGYIINATDTVTRVGAQGRLTEVYSDRIVMIDTFLAQVASVADAAYDAAGHLRTPATITLTVFDADGVTTSNASNANTRTLTLTNGTTNYPYARGEFVLLNAYTNATNSVTVSGTVIVSNTGKYGEIVGKATSVAGAQSVIYWNAQQHNVGGTVYNDAVKFYLDDAGNETTNHTWFFDSYGNLIGAVDIAAATSYGVITSIWWAGNTADGSGLANATVTYMDGTTGTVTISKMTVNTNGTVGAAYTAATGKPTYSIVNSDIMTVSGNFFYVSTDAATNARSDANGIVGTHLFQFTTEANGTVTAMEVSGANGNGDVYTKMASVTTAINKNTQIYNGLIVDANTVFLIKNGNTLTSVTGFANVGSYVSGEVDYVDLDVNGVADYVYITAAAMDSQVTSLLYYTGEQMSYSNGVWTIPCYVDGVYGSVTVADPNGYLPNCTIANFIANNSYNLLKAELKNGLVMNCWAYSVTDRQLAASNVAYPLAPVYAPYGSNVYVELITGAIGDSYNGSVYHDADKGTYAGYYSYVEGLTKVYGDFTADMSGKNVIVVYHKNSSNADNGTMLQAYVVDKNTVVPDLRPINPVTLTISGAANGYTVGSATTTINYAGYGASTNGGDQATLKVTSITWYKADANGQFTIPLSASDVFVSGGIYSYVATMAIDNGDFDGNGVNGCYLPSNAQTVTGTITVA